MPTITTEMMKWALENVAVERSAAIRDKEEERRLTKTVTERMQESIRETMSATDKPERPLDG